MSSGRWIDTYAGRILMALAFLTLVVGFAAWQYPKIMKKVGEPQMYHLRVQVKSQVEDVLRDSTVHVSAGNEPQLLPDGWWEIEIAAAKVPASGKIKVTVEHDDWATVSEEFELGDDPNPSLEVILPPRPPVSSLLVGTVLDADDHGIPGARVSVMGHSVGVVETDGDGRFEVQLPVAQGEKVKLHVDSGPLPPRVAYCYIGTACEIWLQEE